MRRQNEGVVQSDRAMLAVAAAFVAVAGVVWCVLSILVAAAALGFGPGLAEEVVRVGGPPAVVAVAAGAVSTWMRRTAGR